MALSTAACRALSPIAMVRNYVKKGGHGGHRSNSGLSPNHWMDQGGRGVVKQRKEKEKAAAKAKAEDNAQKAAERWKQMCTTSSAQPTQPKQSMSSAPSSSK